MPIPKVSASDVKKMIQNLPQDDQKQLLKTLQKETPDVFEGVKTTKTSFWQKLKDIFSLEGYSGSDGPDPGWGDICGTALT